jgi:hypothetical protein
MVDLELLEHRLLAAALTGRAVTYGELLAFFERRVTPINVRALCRDLGQVCERIEAAGGPDLACLVVRASDRLPGAGYFQAMRAAGQYAGPDAGEPAERFVAAAQARAQAYAQARAAAEMPAAPLRRQAPR